MTFVKLRPNLIAGSHGQDIYDDLDEPYDKPLFLQLIPHAGSVSITTTYGAALHNDILLHACHMQQPQRF